MDRYLDTWRLRDGVHIVTSVSAAVSPRTQRGVFVITSTTSLNGATCFLFLILFTS